MWPNWRGENVVEASSLVINYPKTLVRDVLHSDGSKFDTRLIWMLRIATGRNSVKFWPADIKKKFPKIVQFEIMRSGLTHLEREDMRQFGDDLIQVNFDGNLLTALEGDVFEFNLNLEYIGLHHNPLKFIDPQFFQNFLKLRKLKWVEIQNSDCINQASRAPRIMNWRADKCSDETAKMKNLNAISERGVFFS